MTDSAVAAGVVDTERAAPIRRVAAVVSLGAIVVILDGVVVNVALETLSRRLHASLPAVQWVVTAYALALATAVPLTGWAMHRVGARRLWMAALAAFTGCSVLCGLSWSIGSLIAFRALQGVGGGMVIPAGHALVVSAAGRERLGRVMSMVNMPLLVGPILGPLLGGALLDTLGWRSIFFVNVPLCGLALLAARRVLPNAEPGGRRPLDLRGLLLLSPGLTLLLFGLSRAAAGATRVGIELATAGVVLIAAFVLHARLRGRDALLDVSLFARRAFAAPVVVAFMFSFLMSGALVLYPLYWQLVRGHSALAAGLLIAPQGLGSLVTISVIGRLADRYGARRLAPIGIALAVVGTLPYARIGIATPYALLAVALVVRGMGLSCLSTPAYAAAYASLEPDEVPRATTAYNITGRVGGALSVAVAILVFEQSFPSGGDTAAAAAAFRHCFTLLAALTAFVLVPAALLPRRLHEAG